MEGSNSGSRAEGSRSREVSSSRPALGLSAWCHTGAARTVEFTHRWTIDDFETKTRTYKVGEKIVSNEFLLGGQRASLKVYPNGTVGNKGHVSIFLENKSEEPLHISEVVFTFHATGAPPLTWNAPKKELDSEDDWGFQRFVAVQKLREKKLVSEDGTLEIVTKITREQQSKNVSFDMHQRDEDGEGLACQLYEAWQGGSFVDFTLHCQGLSIPCHRIVLGARSDFFRGLLCTELEEASRDSFVVQDLDVDTLRLMLDYLYLGKIRDNVEALGAEQVQLLMNAADYYVVPGLKRLCEQWLVETLNTTNMVDRLILGDTFNAEKLRYTAKEMLLANSKKLDSIPDWRNKLATRTELVLEVLGELARSSL